MTLFQPDAAAGVFAIEIHDVSMRLGQVLALNSVSVNIAQGQWTSIVGPNGAGKSTLLRVMAGLTGLNQKVLLSGNRLSEITPKHRAKRIAWLGQNELVTGDISVYALVMLGRLPHQPWLQGPSALDHQVVTHALEVVHALDWKDRSIAELSGGEQQRVFIARALAVEADILLMDEPLSHLDPPHQSDCLHLIRDLIRAGKTVVTVLHEIGFALHADQLIVMNQGSMVYQGSSMDDTAHRQVEHVFDNRIKIYPFMDRLIVLPV